MLQLYLASRPVHRSTEMFVRDETGVYKVQTRTLTIEGGVNRSLSKNDTFQGRRKVKPTMTNYLANKVDVE